MNDVPRKVFRIGTVRYNWPMSAHASQAFSIEHCTDSEDLPVPLPRETDASTMWKMFKEPFTIDKIQTLPCRPYNTYPNVRVYYFSKRRPGRANSIQNICMLT